MYSYKHSLPALRDQFNPVSIWIHGEHLQAVLLGVVLVFIIAVAAALMVWAIRGNSDGYEKRDSI
jgi:flagellar biosynthesis/type III secretory pathway M-ring protein FliF/YscJ